MGETEGNGRNKLGEEVSFETRVEDSMRTTEE